jgi:hypothetical protein
MAVNHYWCYCPQYCAHYCSQLVDRFNLRFFTSFETLNKYFPSKTLITWILTLLSKVLNLKYKNSPNPKPTTSTRRKIPQYTLHHFYNFQIFKHLILIFTTLNIRIYQVLHPTRTWTIILKKGEWSNIALLLNLYAVATN